MYGLKNYTLPVVSVTLAHRREKMKVKIEFTVEIDPDAWILNYGCEPHQVRDDVKSYCRYGVFGQLENVGVLKESGE